MWSFWDPLCGLWADFKAVFAGGGTAPKGGPHLLLLTLSSALFPRSRWFIAIGVGTDGPNGCLTQAAKVREKRFQNFITHIKSCNRSSWNHVVDGTTTWKMTVIEDSQMLCMCIKSSWSFSHKLMIAQIVKTFLACLATFTAVCLRTLVFLEYYTTSLGNQFQMFHRNTPPTFSRFWSLRRILHRHLAHRHVYGVCWLCQGTSLCLKHLFFSLSFF